MLFLKELRRLLSRGREGKQRTARIINSLRGRFKLKRSSRTGMPKATYMYWQKRFDKKILIRKSKKRFLRFGKYIRIMDIVECLASLEIRDMSLIKESSAYHAKSINYR